MEEVYVTDKAFDRLAAGDLPLPKGDYEHCVFSSCDLSNADLSSIKFIACAFNNCNLSLANLAGTAFQEVTFKDCKLLGLRFDHCNQFGMVLQFDSCLLNHSSFFRTKLKKIRFQNCPLHEADFTEADLTLAIFEQCDFTLATFDNTILEKADFRTSLGYAIDPEKNKVKKARFSLSGLPGLLGKYQIITEQDF